MFPPAGAFFNGLPPNQTELTSPSGIRSLKRDRHSKIHTAHGTRDRRMRLSREIARMFFDLQDMLGFERASKTVEWLFVNSGTAIEDLYRARNSSSFKIPPTDCTHPPLGSVLSSRKTTMAMKREKAKERTREKRRAEETQNQTLTQSQTQIQNFPSNSMLNSELEDGNMDMSLQEVFLSSCDQITQNNDHDLVLVMNGVQVQQEFPEYYDRTLWWV